MATETTRRQVQAALRRLSLADLETAAYRQEALALLRRVVGFDAWCWSLLDPASGLPTHAVADNPAAAGNQARFHRLLSTDATVPHQWGDAVTVDSAVSLLSESTGGRLQASPSWSEVLGPAGVGDQLAAGGLCWGHLSLHRGADGGWFTESDRAFIAELAPTLATPLRRAVRTVAGHDALDDGDEPGTLVLDPDLRLLAVTPQAQRRLRELAPAPTRSPDPLPGFVYALAARIDAGGGQPRKTGARARPQPRRAVARPQGGSALAGGSLRSRRLDRRDDRAGPPRRDRAAAHAGVGAVRP